MREILFRGKLLNNGEWVEGAFFPESDQYPATIFHGRHNSLGDYVDPATVGQFTGLLDKNGKRIFEWDVVRYGNKTGYVIYGNGCFCVQDSTTQNRPAIDLVMDQWDVTVIGNIHDPELLEVTPDE